MCECKSTWVSFRTLQAICDLRAVARLASNSTRSRIAAGANSPDAEAHLAALIGPDGCRIDRPETLLLHQALILSATLPNDDFDAFQFATAILIADRLQDGWGQDDLFWHWDAFHDHYALADAPIRGALMRGYQRMEAEGLVSLENPPAAGLVTEHRDAVEAALKGLEHEAAGPLLRALEGASPDPDFWALHCQPYLDAQTETPKQILRGIRHLFERQIDWEPFGDACFDPDEADQAPILPFPSA